MNELALDEGAPEPAQALKHLKVLVIDERMITRRTLELILAAEGADVTAVDSIGEALALLTVRAFDAVVTDAALPGMGRWNGRAVLENFPGPNRGAPVIAPGAAHETSDISHAAGMTLEIGGFIDPGEICRALGGLSPRPPHAAAA
jgi:CheY-like chemotaxis protein